MSWQKFCLKTLHLLGWREDPVTPTERECVILGVPHTCIGDFLISYLFYTGLGHTAHIMIKKEFFFWPVGKLLKKVGCIPVDRSKGAGVVMGVLSAMKEADGEFHLCIAPEGTRKLVHKWKMGYHTIARAMNCPVYLGYFDWNTKTVSCGCRFDLSDNAREDTDKIQAIYESMNLGARHPEKYATH